MNKPINLSIGNNNQIPHLGLKAKSFIVLILDNFMKHFMLKLETGKLNNREFFRGLKGRDRKNLTEVLCVMRDKGIIRVQVKGSSLEDKKSGYDGVNLSCHGFNYRCLQELKKRGAEIIDILSYEMGNRYQFSFKETDFDITHRKIGTMQDYFHLSDIIDSFMDEGCHYINTR